MEGKRILVIGFGNPGRGMTALGRRWPSASGRCIFPAWTVESDTSSPSSTPRWPPEHEIVVFADAALDAAEPFYFRSVTAARSSQLHPPTAFPGRRSSTWQAPVSECIPPPTCSESGARHRGSSGRA